jgi:hypothetical protein
LYWPSRKDYEEKGEDDIGENFTCNYLVRTPQVDPVEAERNKKLQSSKRVQETLVGGVAQANVAPYVSKTIHFFPS